MSMKSKFLRLMKNDFIKGAIMAAMGAVTGGVYTALSAGQILTVAVLEGSAKAGALAGLTYLTKNLLTNSKDEFGKKD